jgi:isopentenyl-diphosphate delta-isomerase
MLIVVDVDDNILDYRHKRDCHRGSGILHRALSVFLFNAAGDVVLQQRSAQKQLWPLYWANSCCSHPRQGESVEQAAHRRVEEELSVTATLRPIFKFVYQAQFTEEWAEHELCSVFVGHYDGDIQPNIHEIAAIDCVSPEQLDLALKNLQAPYTPWLRMEWPRLRREYWSQIEQLLPRP